VPERGGKKATTPVIRAIRRANQRRGHGTSEKARPPVVGTVGRESGQCRLRVRAHTDGKTWQQHGRGYTKTATTCYTEEGQGDNPLNRSHPTGCHGEKEGAREDDGDGIREVHPNTSEGLWTTAGNFLRPFRGVHQKYLHHYLARCEHKINLTRISPKFIAPLVAPHESGP
jgi:transposase